MAAPAHASQSISPTARFDVQLPQLTPNNQIATAVLVVVISLLILEQSVWRMRRGKLAGKTWQIPIIGQFLESLHPTFQGYQRSFASRFAAISVFNIFIVVTSKVEDVRRILNASTSTEPCLVRSAKDILLPENWVFLNGKAHNDYRKGLNVLFTRQALGIYLDAQVELYRETFAKWIADPEPNPKVYQLIFREFNMKTSLKVFCGEYITPAVAKEISDQFWVITSALQLVNFPFAFPGSKVWKACRERAKTLRHLENAIAESKRQVADGKKPDCLLDEWCHEIILAKEYREGKSGGERPNLLLREYSDREMAMVIFSFIFASQDAMSSSVTFAFQHLADYPEVLQKVREEQETLRGHDLEAPLTLDLLDEMHYTNAVSKEVLRHRPPVIMVPYKTTKDYQLDTDYVVRKGTMLIPSFWNALHDPEVYPDPDDFLPQRWLPGGVNANGQDSKNWLVFGAGAHKCIAQTYVIMHMTAVMSIASMMMDWTHEKTPDSDDYQLVPTIYPKDGCRMKFMPRATSA